MADSFKKFANAFSENAFRRKIAKYARQAGMQTVYAALLMFYAYKRRETPVWAKNIAIGALGYLISPLDFLPDLTPIIGYTDDIGVLSFGLVTIAGFVNNEVKDKAKERLRVWFGNFNDTDLAQVDERL
ncbi:MAG: DUF1232 domain-containing protein [Saprospiraceae bacterium]|nr:DUF1232 domain-containing protein [Saprospiraceae bacterium]